MAVSTTTGAERAGGAVGEGEPGSTARRRLRDLRGNDRLLAGALFVLLLLPFVVALVRAYRDGWIPSGDEANIATSALDVFSRHPPLTGLPSTSLLYGNKIATNHPGPMEFYLLAIPLRVLGITLGPLLTAAAINAACVLITAWVFFRRLGLTAMLWVGVLLAAVMWSGGTAVLTDTLSSNMTMYSVLCAAVLVWALVDGDFRLLPLAAFVASYAAQQHLAAALIVIALTAVAVVSMGVLIVSRVRRGDTTIVKTARRSAVGAVIVALVCWAPVLINEVTGHPGNLTQVVKFARDDPAPKLGLRSGVYQAIHAIAPPTILLRRGTTGTALYRSPGLAAIVIGLLLVAALVALAWSTRRRSVAVARLALVALALFVVGIVNGAGVPIGVDSIRINIYRWTWALALLAWAALVLGIATVTRRTLSRTAFGRAAIARAPVALLVVVALVTAAIAFGRGPGDHNREVPDFRAEKRVTAQVFAHLDRTRPVLVTSQGSDAILSIAPYVIFRLIKAGLHVEVSAFGTSTAGIGHTYRPGSHPTNVFIATGKAEEASGFGQLIAIEPLGPGRTKEYDTLAATRTALLRRLSAQALGTKVELAPGASAIIGRLYSGVGLLHIDQLIAGLPTNPLAAFEDPGFLGLAAAGILRSPALDHNDLQRLVDLPAYRYRGAYGDEQVEVHIITPL